MKSLFRKAYMRYAGGSLQKNSTLLILGQLVSTAVGFLFWVICSHIFRPSQIGFATALTGYAGLVATFTSLGLSNTILRFLPTSEHRGGLLSGSFLVILGASAIGGLLAIAGVHAFIPRLDFVSSSGFLLTMLVLLVIGTNLSTLMDSVLLASRKANLVLGKSIIVNSLRIILPFLVVAFGLGGIMAVYVSVLLVGTVYGLVAVRRGILPHESFKPTLAEVVKHRSYSLSNYFGGMLGMLPGTLVPLIILSKLGPTYAAYYYMPMQIASFLTLLSSSVSQALISETSQSENPEAGREHFRNALVHLYRLLVPAVGCLWLTGWLILRAYGSSYATNGFWPLAVLSLSSLFIGVNWLGDAWLNIKKRNAAYFYMNAFNALAVIAGVYLMSGGGLTYAALGVLIGQAVSALVYFIIFAHGQLLPRPLWSSWLSLANKSWYTP